MTAPRPATVAAIVALAAVAPAAGQFLDSFDEAELRVDPSGSEGWSFFAGDGDATVDFVATGDGHASILVDATSDRRNVWWALIKHRVSERMDLEQLGRTGWELRVEARIRVSHAPRRVNLHVNTQRTTDFHSHLMEFDIPTADVWQTISMTTRDFPVEPGDTVFAQMALMDWGRATYRVDVDYIKVDVVESGSAGGDCEAAVPYHPPVPDPASFRHAVAAEATAVIDLANPEVNLAEWSVPDGGGRRPVLTASGTLWTILRFDLGALRGLRVAGHGLLELTTDAVRRDAREIKDMGLVRVVEILAGKPAWVRQTVTLDGLLAGEASENVFNPQPIIDWPVSEAAGEKTLLVLSRPVLQRLLDGRTLGLAVTPLGPIDASFRCDGSDAPRLLFNLEK